MPVAKNVCRNVKLEIQLHSKSLVIYLPEISLSFTPLPLKKEGSSRVFSPILRSSLGERHKRTAAWFCINDCG